MFKLERLFKPNVLLPFIFTALHLSECSEFRFWQDLRTIIMQQVLDRKKKQRRNNRLNLELQLRFRRVRCHTQMITGPH